MKVLLPTDCLHTAPPSVSATKSLIHSRHVTAPPWSQHFWFRSSLRNLATFPLVCSFAKKLDASFLQTMIDLVQLWDHPPLDPEKQSFFVYSLEAT